MEFGPISYSEFIESCLYDVIDGFYVSNGFAGRRGDFLTSSEVGPLFGAVLVNWIDSVWEDLGQPSGFTVVEVGAGRGTLARSIIAASPRCLENGSYVMVERSSFQRLSHPSGIRIISSSDLPTEKITGVVIANELLDNLPFDLIEADGQQWHEVCVGIKESGNLTEVISDSCYPKICLEPKIGSRIPIQDIARSWVVSVLDLLEAGSLLVIDYTSTTLEMATRPVTEWLRTYCGHNSGNSPLYLPGSQDITVEVAFDQLPSGFTMTSQADFMETWGISDLVFEGHRIWEESASVGDLRAVKARSRISEAEALCDLSGLGSFSAIEWKVGC